MHPPRLAVTILSAFTTLLSGCALQTTASPAPIEAPALTGHVRGGQQPVTGSAILLYAAGATGYSSAATPLIPTGSYFAGGKPGCVASASQTCYPNVVTDATGSFTITGDYTCPSSTAQVYITATGGNPGLTPSTNNTALALMTALGACGNLSASTAIIINEVTTVGAVWPLAPFMSGYASVGSSSTNPAGLARAFVNSAALVPAATGIATGGYNPNLFPSHFPQATIDSLANALASCVNSNGSTAAGSNCALLFSAATPSGASAPTDTIGAALNIALHPGSNVLAVFNAAAPTAPFQPALAAVPNDWLVYITYQSLLKFLTDTALDANGNFWQLTSYQSSLANTIGPSQTGTLDAQGLADASMAFDTSGNFWSAVENDSMSGYSISVVNPAGARTATYAYPSLPGRIDFDKSGNLWLQSSGSTSVVSPSGASLATTTSPVVGVGAADSTGAMWSTSGNVLYQTYLSGSAFTTTAFFGGNLSSPLGLAIDHSGNVWILNSNSSISEISNVGYIYTSTAAYTGGGLNTSGATGLLRPICVDGAGNIWAASYTGNVLSEFNNSGVPISPSTGYAAYITANAAGESGVVPASQPLSVAVDQSGDVWTVGLSNLANTSVDENNPYTYTVTLILGAATPVVAPLSLAAATNTIGTRP